MPKNYIRNFNHEVFTYSKNPCYIVIHSHNLFNRTPPDFQSNKSIKKDLVKDAIQLTITVNRMKQHFIWGTVNALVLSMLTYDL